MEASDVLALKWLDSIIIADRRTAQKLAKDNPDLLLLGVGEENPRGWGGECVWMPLEDGVRIDVAAFLKAVDLCAALVKRGPTCVCCHAGESRSSAVVVAWMLIHQRPFVRERMGVPIDFPSLPPLFRESHRWAVSDEEARRQEVPKELLGSPFFPEVFACYASLSAKFPRILINVGLWRAILASSVFQSRRMAGR